jgi:hypothetical protein
MAARLVRVLESYRLHCGTVFRAFRPGSPPSRGWSSATETAFQHGAEGGTSQTEAKRVHDHGQRNDCQFA